MQALVEFRPWCKKTINMSDNLEICCKCSNACCDDEGIFYDCALKRAPQSWCYVEELK